MNLYNAKKGGSMKNTGISSYVFFSVLTLMLSAACGGSGDSGNGDNGGNGISAAWTTEDVDTSGNVGIDPAIAVDGNNTPHICYYDQTSRDLKYAVKNSWEAEVVDSDGDVGEECGIAVDALGNPHISSNHGSTTNILVYATKSGGSWAVQDFGQPEDYHTTSTSIALDSSGNPHIAYNIQENSDDAAQVDYRVRYTYYDGSAWQVENVARIGQDVFLAIDSDDNSHVSFRVEDQDAGSDIYRITYAKRTSGTWSTETVDSSTDAGGDTGIAVDTSNDPHIVYRDYGNGAVRYAYNDGDGWGTEEVDADAGAQEGTKIAVGSDDLPRIAYSQESTENLIYAVRQDGAWSFETIDKMGNPAIAVDSSNIPHVAHNHTWDNAADEEYLRYSVRE